MSFVNASTIYPEFDFFSRDYNWLINCFCKERIWELAQCVGGISRILLDFVKLSVRIVLFSVNYVIVEVSILVFIVLNS